jgi:predicted phosphoribosyltransferase
VFADRRDAGRQLAEELLPYQKEDCLVLALPRGGVVVGYEVAKRLQAPLDVLVVRKIGAPGQEELAVGAVGPENVVVWNWDLLNYLRFHPEDLENIVQREKLELKRRQEAFRGQRPFPDLQGKTVIVVDDGLATGATARAAIQAAKALRPGKVVLAVPVGSRSTANDFRQDVDDLVCLETPVQFSAVSQWYEKFPQNSDREVIELLSSAWRQEAGQSPSRPN